MHDALRFAIGDKQNAIEPIIVELMLSVKELERWIRRRRPASAKGLEKTAGGEELGQAHLDEGILRSEQRLLGLQDRDQIDCAAAKLRFRDVESLAGRSDHIGLKLFLQRVFLQGNESLFDVGEGGQHCFAIGLQILNLQALGLLQLALEKESVEQRLGQSGGKRVVPGTGHEQGCERGTLITGLGGQLDLWEERGASGVDAEV